MLAHGWGRLYANVLVSNSLALSDSLMVQKNSKSPFGRLQVSLPVAMVDGCPLGLSVIGPRGSDEDLLRLCARLMALLKQSAGVRAEV